MNGWLVLENGTRFKGTLLGNAEGFGELVFNTGMTGYQECFTDPSYEGQILTLTYPLIGNYGANDAFMQKDKPSAAGYVIDQLTVMPSNWECEEPLAAFISRYNVPCLYNVDTRAVTRELRKHGVMKGVIVSEEKTEEEIKALLARPMHHDQIARVTTKKPYTVGGGKYKVALLDCGLKKNIVKSLVKNDCTVHVFPAYTPAEELLAINPDGIFLSPGPGDPQDVPEIIENVKKLIGKKPIFGICMGLQLLSIAMGAKTFKLPFGHRGSNHPVKDLRTGRVYITSQNHGYAVSEEDLPDCMEVTHRSVNDGTIEGIRHKELPVQAVQYHPEAAPGPTDNFYLFAEFARMMEEYRK
jgi:carbamoyl-phosphate synthase small subunit